MLNTIKQALAEAATTQQSVMQTDEVDNETLLEFAHLFSEMDDLSENGSADHTASVRKPIDIPLEDDIEIESLEINMGDGRVTDIPSDASVQEAVEELGMKYSAMRTFDDFYNEACSVIPRFARESNDRYESRVMEYAKMKHNEYKAYCFQEGIFGHGKISVSDPCVPYRMTGNFGPKNPDKENSPDYIVTLKLLYQVDKKQCITKKQLDSVVIFGNPDAQMLELTGKWLREKLEEKYTIPKNKSIWDVATPKEAIIPIEPVDEYCIVVSFDTDFTSNTEYIGIMIPIKSVTKKNDEYPLAIGLKDAKRFNDHIPFNVTSKTDIQQEQYEMNRPSRFGNNQQSYTEAHHRKTGIGLLLGSFFPGIGQILGYEIGRHSWKEHAAEELVLFIHDLAEAIDRSNGFKIAKRIDRVSQACDICMNTSKSFTDEQLNAIKKLKVDTIGLKEIDEDVWQHILHDFIIPKDMLQKGASPFTGYIKPVKKAIESWTKSAEECIELLTKNSAYQESISLGSDGNTDNANAEPSADVQPEGNVEPTTDTNADTAQEPTAEKVQVNDVSDQIAQNVAATNDVSEPAAPDDVPDTNTDMDSADDVNLNGGDDLSVPEMIDGETSEEPVVDPTNIDSEIDNLNSDIESNTDDTVISDDLDNMTIDELIAQGSDKLKSMTINQLKAFLSSPDGTSPEDVQESAKLESVFTSADNVRQRISVAIYDCLKGFKKITNGIKNEDWDTNKFKKFWSKVVISGDDDPFNTSSKDTHFESKVTDLLHYVKIATNKKRTQSAFSDDEMKQMIQFRDDLKAYMDKCSIVCKPGRRHDVSLDIILNETISIEEKCKSIKDIMTSSKMEVEYVTEASRIIKKSINEQILEHIKSSLGILNDTTMNYATLIKTFKAESKQLNKLLSKALKLKKNVYTASEQKQLTELNHILVDLSSTIEVNNTNVTYTKTVKSLIKKYVTACKQTTKMLSGKTVQECDQPDTLEENDDITIPDTNVTSTDTTSTTSTDSELSGIDTVGEN